MLNIALIGIGSIGRKYFKELKKIITLPEKMPALKLKRRKRR